MVKHTVRRPEIWNLTQLSVAKTTTKCRSYSVAHHPSQRAFPQSLHVLVSNQPADPPVSFPNLKIRQCNNINIRDQTRRSSLQISAFETVGKLAVETSARPKSNSLLRPF
jgi:hypothetical protein